MAAIKPLIKDILCLEKITIVLEKSCEVELYGPFLRMAFNYLKARATSRRQFTFYH